MRLLFESNPAVTSSETTLSDTVPVVGVNKTPLLLTIGSTYEPNHVFDFAQLENEGFFLKKISVNHEPGYYPCIMRFTFVHRRTG